MNHWWVLTGDKNRDCELKWDSGRVRGFNHRTCRFRHQTRGENRKWLVLDGEKGWLDNLCFNWGHEILQSDSGMGHFDPSMADEGSV